MDREQFLKQVWKSYPAVTEKGAGDRFGRVLERGKEGLRFHSANGDWTLLPENLQAEPHSQWGPAVPTGCLREGDWVAFCGVTQSLHLMAPSCNGFPSESGDREWFDFLDKVETFFVDLGFEKVRTPFLVTSPGVDHHIDFLKVTGDQTKKVWYLPTSPEISLKKYLTQGFENIFEVKSCFRDDWPGSLHKTEFTMLEWYRSFVGLESLMDDVKNLVKNLSGYEGPFEVKSVREAFEETFDFSLQPDTPRAALLSMAESQGIHCAADDDWNDLFFRLFIEKIEPGLGMAAPLFLTGFPPSQSSLAQLDSEGWCQRFEFYWQGVELANAYLEQNDPEANRRIFGEQESLRRSKGVELAPQDEEFFKALEWGMPPCSGIALGLDRLYQIFCTK